VVPGKGNIMNKLVKGSIAGAAGIALLLGGAGTFALWNDSATVAAAPITTGQLRLVDEAPTAAGVWTDTSTAGRIGTITSTSKMVPGDTWTYTKALKVTAVGKNLLADLSFDPASIAIAGVPTNELSYVYTAAPAVTTGSATVARVDGSTTTYRLTPGTAADTVVTFTVAVTYNNVTGTSSTGTPVVVTDGNVLSGQNQTTTAAALKIALKQVRSTTP
jgi:alternate signal-mediated exported protein